MTIQFTTTPIEGATLFTTTPIEGGATLLEFEIPGGICEPADLATFNPPEVPGTGGVVISGRGPVWLYAALAHHYHTTQWVGTFDPRLGGAVVTSRHSRTAPPVGSVVALPKTVPA
jgi:CRISPR-associated protein Csx3